MTEPLWIVEQDARTLHDRLLALYSGALGVRDRGVMDSALARAKQIYSYAYNPTVIEMAAAYTAAIVRKRPFIDGNNRTGFLVGVLFLELNGYIFTGSEEDAAQAVLQLAEGTLDEVVYANFLRVNTRRA
jgi:death-on-curing protein